MELFFWVETFVDIFELLEVRLFVIFILIYVTSLLSYPEVLFVFVSIIYILTPGRLLQSGLLNENLGLDMSLLWKLLDDLGGWIIKFFYCSIYFLLIKCYNYVFIASLIWLIRFILIIKIRLKLLLTHFSILSHKLTIVSKNTIWDLLIPDLAIVLIYCF